MEINLLIVIILMVLSWIDHEMTRRGSGYGASILLMLTAIAVILLLDVGGKT